MVRQKQKTRNFADYKRIKMSLEFNRITMNRHNEQNISFMGKEVAQSYVDGANGKDEAWLYLYLTKGGRFISKQVFSAIQQKVDIVIIHEFSCGSVCGDLGYTQLAKMVYEIMMWDMTLEVD